jgi:hypothetical protein
MFKKPYFYVKQPFIHSSAVKFFKNTPADFQELESAVKSTFIGSPLAELLAADSAVSTRRPSNLPVLICKLYFNIVFV